MGAKKRPSYGDAHELFHELMRRVDDPYAQLRAQQIFAAIRKGGGGISFVVRIRGFFSAAKQYMGNIGLACWSLYIFFLLRKRGDGSSVHFCVDVARHGDRDPRSAFLSPIFDQSAVVTFCHYGDAWNSLRKVAGQPRTLYPEALVRVLWPLWRLMAWWRAGAPAGDDPMLQMALREAAYARLYLWVLQSLFEGLQTRRLVLLDDPRNMPVYCRAARACGVQTIGYMHGKFNAFHVGLTVEAFDTYLVWGNYFKAKMEQMWDGRYPGRIVVSGLTREGVPYHLAGRRKQQDPLCVLWLDEDEVSLDEIQPFFMRLAETKGIKVILRLKPRTASRQAAFPVWYLSTFSRDDQGNFWQSLTHHGVDIVIGCHSTALLEAAMIGIAPLALETGFDYARDLGRDGVVLPCCSPDQMVARIEDVRGSTSGSRKREFPYVKLAIEPFDPLIISTELARIGFVLRNSALTPKNSNTD